MTDPGTVRPPPYGDADQPDPEPFVSWAARNPAKVLITVAGAALAIWANFALAAYVEDPRLQSESYPRTAVLEIETHDEVCWTASDLRGIVERGCGNAIVTVRRSRPGELEFRTPAFFASVVKKKQTDVRNITARLIIDGDVVDTVTTNNFTASVTTPN